MEEVEEWRKLPIKVNDKHWYEVSNLGRVRAIRILSPFKVYHGNTLRSSRHRRKYRLMVTLHGEGKSGIPVHRLVAIVFCEKDDARNHVNHKDGNPLNNRPDNLEWVTNEENIEHARKNGLHIRGKEHLNNKIDPEIAVKMRLSGASFTDIGSRFGASCQAAKKMLELLGMAWPAAAKPPKRKRPKNNTYTIKQALELRKSGLSWEEISAHFGVGKDAVRMRLSRHGLL